MKSFKQYNEAYTDRFARCTDAHSWSTLVGSCSMASITSAHLILPAAPQSRQAPSGLSVGTEAQERRLRNGGPGTERGPFTFPFEKNE